MDGITFALDSKALLLASAFGLIVFFLVRWRQRFEEPLFFFPDLSSLNLSQVKARWAPLPKYLLWTSLLLFLLAFIDPHFFFGRRWDQMAEPGQKHFPSPTEGIAIYLVLDQSGSMKEEIPTARRRHNISKIDLLKQVTRQFIAGDRTMKLNGRPNDLIGLMVFARGAQVLAPLTLDHQAVLKDLDKLQPIDDVNQNGTAIGYAIYKTASMIAATRHYAQELIDKGEPAYNIKNSVMILITDGLQDPNPLDKGKRLRNIDIEEAAQYAKEQGIRLYIINVDPNLAKEEFAPHRNIMRRSAEATGGKFYMIDYNANLGDIYHEIDQLEKSALPPAEEFSKEERPDLFNRFSLYPYLIAAGLICLFVASLLETTFLRRIP